MKKIFGLFVTTLGVLVDLTVCTKINYRLPYTTQSEENITDLPPLESITDKKYLWQCLLGSATAWGYFCSDIELTQAEKLKCAMNLVNNCKLTYEQAGFYPDVPKSTLSDHMTGKSKKIGRGRNTLLTAKEEKILAEEMRNRNIKILQPIKKTSKKGKEVAKRGKLQQCMKRTHEIALQKQIEPLMKSEKVGRKWFANFVRRHNLY